MSLKQALEKNGLTMDEFAGSDYLPSYSVIRALNLPKFNCQNENTLRAAIQIRRSGRSSLDSDPACSLREYKFDLVRQGRESDPALIRPKGRIYCFNLTGLGR